MKICPKCSNEMEEMKKEGDVRHAYHVCHHCEYVIKSTACEVYSRVCGYLRPVSGWNLGKKQEFTQRKNYKISKKNTKKIVAEAN